jgi:hypothetical protein
MIKNVQWSSHKELMILVRFRCNLDFFDRLLKNTQISNFMEICPEEGAWGSVVVKALRYLSDSPGIDSRWCHWIFQ